MEGKSDSKGGRKDGHQGKKNSRAEEEGTKEQRKADEGRREGRNKRREERMYLTPFGSVALEGEGGGVEGGGHVHTCKRICMQ